MKHALARSLAFLLLSACTATAELPLQSQPVKDSSATDTNSTTKPEVELASNSTESIENVSLQGNILLPSGLKQTDAGILLPSGILMPSGILLPSGFQTMSETDGENESKYDNVIFKVQAFDAEKGDLIAETLSDGQGRYLFQNLPNGTRMQLVARAENAEDVELKAMADLSQAKGVAVRNLSLETLAAILLFRESQDAENEELSVDNLQNEAAFKEPVQSIAKELTSLLGKKPIVSLTDAGVNARPAIEKAREIVRVQPLLRHRRPDPLHDPNFFPPRLGPGNWPIPTALRPPKSAGQGNPTLPDGTCPPPPPENGVLATPPPPFPDGTCPLPNSSPGDFDPNASPPPGGMPLSDGGAPPPPGGEMPPPDGGALPPPGGEMPPPDGGAPPPPGGEMPPPDGGAPPPPPKG